MKKSLLSLLFLLLTKVASAYDFEVDGIYYNIINGNEVAVTYKGSDPYGNDDKYTGDVSIPSFVAYNSKTYCVVAIGNNAFGSCRGLKSIVIPNSVISIGDLAFMFCIGLKSIAIPNSVVSIGNNAFKACSGLKSIVIPNSVRVIGNEAFSICDGLTSISVESDNVIYDSRDNCNAIIETSSNTLIAGCKNSIIPNSVTAIGNYAFCGCSGLNNIVIPNSVTSIGSGVFIGCSGLTCIEIPNTVTCIGQGAFSSCDGLTSISVESGNVIYDSRDNCNAVIETSSNTLITGCKNSIIPNSVTIIGNFAFYGCRDLPSIVIPNSVTAIGDYAFYNCYGLTSIGIGNSVTIIGNFAFYGCRHLPSIVIPNSVTAIGDYAFAYCTGFASIEIGNSVTRIGEYALVGCSGLTTIYCYSQNPPACYGNTFDSYTATLHVPAASLAAYFTAPYWSNFENIIGDAVAPTGISISNDSINLQPDEQMRLIATVTPQNASNKEITWMSTDTTVATVDNGVVYAVGCGECDIIASCFGMQAVCHVSVAIRISLDQQEAMLLPNHILTLTPMPTAPGIYAVSSSDPTVAAARVLSSGKIQVVGIREGTTTITVSSVDGTVIPATCLVTVYTETGDLDCDGFVSINDVTSLIDYLLNDDSSQLSTKNADVNGDGHINISDVTALIDALLHDNG